MKHVHFVLFYILLVTLAACSSIQPLQTTPTPIITNQHVPAQVDISLPGEVGINGGATPQLLPNEETVRLGERGGDVYTPVEDSPTIGQGVARRLKVGLSLGPGLYRAINYVSLLKFLERQNLSPQVITGTGFGAIVAAMYATGMTPEVIEWNFYRYFKEKGSYRPYESEWLEEIDQLLLEKFKSKNIQDTVKKFYITLYSAKTKKTYFFNKGNIRDHLLMNLKLSNSSSLYTAAFENEVFNSNLVRKVGAEFVIGADVLGSKFDFEDSNEFLIGVYGRTAGRIAKQKKGFDYFYSIPLNKMSLDSTENGAFYLLKTQEYVEAQSNNLKKLIQQKISVMNNKE